MTEALAVERAREAFERKAWTAARDVYAALVADSTLSLDDIERHAGAAYMLGCTDECRDALARGHREALRLGDVTRAARFAYWIGHTMLFTGEVAQARGWFGRARTLLSERGTDCVEWGYLLASTGVEQLIEMGDPTAASETFRDALAIASRFADNDLFAAAGHGRGRALIQLGFINEGMAVLDEVMVTLTSGDVSPLLVGHVYCGVLEACHDVFDVRRAREWTAALARWCAGPPDLVPYRGPCLVHRVEVMRVRGDWEDAIEVARRACDWLSLPTTPEGPADAFYQLGELHRLRGAYNEADEAYRQASRLGRAPQPGCALLWLSRGDARAAATAVVRALEEPDGDRIRRAELLAAQVEIVLQLRDSTSARVSAEELGSLASSMGALPLKALADRALGAVLIAERDPRAALAPLRSSWTAWKQLQVPYEAARVRAAIGTAYLALDDRQSAIMEFDAARWVFERLGAAPDIARLEAQMGECAPRSPGPLTQREVEVLVLIAAGETNKAIAAALVISEHTVARHVQNMLQKLDASSRASLAAFAVEHRLVNTPPGQN